MRKLIAIPLIAFGLSLVACAQDPPALKQEPLVIVQNDKYGFIDHTGKIVIAPQFAWAEDFEHGYARVYACSSYFWIDTQGNPVAHRSWSTKRFLPKQKGKTWGFVNESDQVVIKPAFDEVLAFSDGAAAVRIGRKWGFIDTSGHQIISPIFSQAFYFHEGVGYANTSGGSVVIDKTGKILAEGYEQLKGIPNEGRVPVSRDNQYGFLDLTGKVAVPIQFEDADMFNEDLAPVKKAGKWGYIDRDGNIAIPFQFDHAGLFSNGLAPVHLGKQSGFIHKSGDFAFLLDFDSAPGFFTGDKDNLFIAKFDVSRFWTPSNKFGLVNTEGKVIWGPADQSPDHPPILGWNEEMKAASCTGVSDSMRRAIVALPAD